MGITDLTPSLVRKCLAEDLAWRCRGLSRRTAEQVCRYGAVVGSVIETLPQCPRCMDLARQRIAESERAGRAFASGTVLAAGTLTSGKGRFQRVWHAPAGGLWLTLVLVNTLLPPASRLIPLAAGVACCEMARQYGLDAWIKWVNDVQVGGRKLAGVLVETMTGPVYGEEYLLIGIGMNLNNVRFPSELAGRAVAARQLLGHDLPLAEAAARLLAKCAWNLGLLHQVEARQLAAGVEQGAADQGHPLLVRWQALSDTMGRRVRFGFNVEEEVQFEAQVAGLAADGSLILELADGSRLVEQAGELLYLD